MPDWRVERLTRRDFRWPALEKHIAREDQTRWAGFDEPESERYYLAVCDGGSVLGQLSLRVNKMVVPAGEWEDGRYSMHLKGVALRETWVETFSVEERFRRRGIGRALQLAALELTRELGCHQMQSWSMPESFENYALKLSLGFAAITGVHIGRNGRRYGGVHFVKVVADDFTT